MCKKRAISGVRNGMSLLELMTATAIMATLMATVVVVVRSGYAAWNAQEADIDRLENAYGVLRHVVRQMRQADSVTNIGSSTLSFLPESGPQRSWSYNNGTSEVYFNNGTNNHVLAKTINSLNFVGYKADGVTPTAVADEVQMLRCTVQVTLPRGAGLTRTVSCRAWLRSW
jgi:prepilin-type N-terminal cleavage/methylation domain-containing protein